MRMMSNVDFPASDTIEKMSFRFGELQMANEISQDVYRSLEEKLSGLSNKTIIGPTSCLEPLRQIPFQSQRIIASAANQA